MSAATHAAELHVVAGILRDTRGRVLLAQRPPGRHLAGAWEFPGGKVEPGEHAAQALRRELLEELGIRISAAPAPLVTVPWRYPHVRLRLEALEVASWDGDPRGLEGQALRWSRPGDIDPQDLAPADRPILAVLLEPDSAS